MTSKTKKIVAWALGCTGLFVACGMVGGTTTFDGFMRVRGSTDPTCAASGGDGDICAGDAIEAEGALDVGGNATIAGALGLTGALTASGGIAVGDDDAIAFGAGTDAACEYDTAQTPDALVCGLSADSRALIIREQGDVADMGHAISTDPTVFIHSSDATDTSQWVSLSHNQTNALLDTGKGIVSVPDGLTILADDKQICWGASTDSCFEYETAQTADALALGLGTDSRSLIVSETGDMSTNWGHAQQTNPTVYIHSADQTDTTDWVSLAHNQSNAVVATGHGGFDMSGPALTSGGTNDFGISMAQTLNDSGAAGGSDVYRGIKFTLTESDRTGWNNVYLADLITGSTSQFQVSDVGTTAVGGMTSITGDALTSGGTDDYTLKLAQTLNDSGAAGGTDVYRGIKLTLTETDRNGWDNVYLADFITGSTSQFQVSDVGTTAIGGMTTVAGDTLTSGGTDDWTVNITQTLNDSGAAGGTDVYRGLKMTLTESDKTGWDSVYMADFIVGVSSVASISDTGLVNSEGGVTVSSDDKQVCLGASNDACFEYETAQTVDSLALGVSADSNSLLVCELADINTDWGHAKPTDPHVYIQSADQATPAKYVGIGHDQSNAHFVTGTGGYGFESSNGKGSSSYILTKSETVTFAGGGGDATKATTGSIIPAGAFVVGVSWRVTTSGTTCTGMDIGIAAKDTDAFADAASVTAGQVGTHALGNVGQDFSAASLGIIPSIGAQEITITGDGGNCVNLVVKLTVHYIGISAATAD